MRVEPELSDHPKFLRLKKIVGEGAMEYLIRLWGHCQGNQRGEYWPGADAEYVEMICRWDAQPGVLFKALLECGRPGFVEIVEEGIAVHDWAEMNSQTVANWNKNRNGRAGKKAVVKPLGNPVDNPVLPLGQQGGSKPQTPEANGKPVLTPLGNQRRSNEEAMTLSVSPSLLLSPEKQSEANGKPVVTPMVTDDYELARQCVLLLNDLTGSRFDPPLNELDGIVGRLIEVNRDLPGLEKMLRRQAALWKSDPKAMHWLKPGTLFGANFHDYYGQRDLPTSAKKTARPRAEILQALAAAREQNAPADHISVLQRELESAA